MRDTSTSEADLGTSLFINLLKKSLVAGNPYASEPTVCSEPFDPRRAKLADVDINRGPYTKAHTMRKDDSSQPKPRGLSFKPKHTAVDWLTSTRIQRSRGDSRPLPLFNSLSAFSRTTKWKRVPYTQQGWVIHRVEPQGAVTNENAQGAQAPPAHPGETCPAPAEQPAGLPESAHDDSADDIITPLGGQDPTETPLTDPSEVSANTETVERRRRKTRRSGKEVRRRRMNAALRAAEAALAGSLTDGPCETSEGTDAADDADAGAALEVDSFLDSLCGTDEGTETHKQDEAGYVNDIRVSGPTISLADSSVRSETTYGESSNEKSSQDDAAVEASATSDVPLPKKKKAYRRSGHAAKLRHREMIANEKREREAQREAELADAKTYLTTFADVPGNVNFVQSGPWLIPTTTVEAFAPVYPSYIAKDFPAFPLCVVDSLPKHQKMKQATAEPSGNSAEHRATGKRTIIAREWTLITTDFREMHGPWEAENETESCKQTSGYIHTKPKQFRYSLFARVNMQFMASGYPPLYLYPPELHPSSRFLPFVPRPDDDPSALASELPSDPSTAPISVVIPGISTIAHESLDIGKATPGIRQENPPIPVVLQETSGPVEEESTDGQEASGRVVPATTDYIATPTADKTASPTPRRRVGVACDHCGHFVPFNPVFARATRDLK
ncbi:hypothetical protein PHLGIDRAFT_204783 [Phlebiopsis gigantea 11061_1 CR5-6]|uniref:Uncharacterized protein n=1 Tax=Phlebiopsis gigantea (strain 11061_1 CR5-6) TaxID=745531 RepID=A0A0C3PF60_PHLG1|nr:hypothetical protein PHLGIDRAFT_204783 [Phlebiopsis gigantea 11061_1 CR5-6]